MKSKEIALCGLLCALAVTMLLLGGILGIGMFAGRSTHTIPVTLL